MEYDTIKQEYDRLEKLRQTYNEATEDKEALEQIILKLRGQLQQYRKLELESHDTARKLNTAEDTVKRLTKRESDLISENIQLCRSIEDLESQNTNLRKSQVLAEKMSDQPSVSVDGPKSDLTVNSLRAKLYQLAKKCKEKDELLRRLLVVLKSSTFGDSLVREVELQLSVDVAQEYLNDVTNISSAPSTPLLRSKNLSSDRIQSRSKKMNLDVTLDSYPGTTVKRDLAHHLPTSRSSGQSAILSRAAREPLQSSSRPVTRTTSVTDYQAIKDYDPQYFSRSGRPHLEIPLRKGDIVHVLGSKDDKGYFEAAVGDKKGLVPANYLIPAQILADTTTTTTNNNNSSIRNKSDPPERGDVVGAATPGDTSQQAPLYTTKQSAPPSESVVLNTNTAIPGPPAAPSGFSVLSAVDDHSIQLGWSPPTMDNKRYSNNTAVQGYKIFVNNRIREVLRNPEASSYTVDKLNLSRQHSFGIQTLADNGLTSSMVTLLYDRAQDPAHQDSSSSPRLPPTVPNSYEYNDIYDETKRRMYMAVYDYTPMSSEHRDTVTVRAGDVVYVYGDQRSDGYYHVKVHGKRGLVPSAFLEVVTQPPGDHSTVTQSSSATAPSAPTTAAHAHTRDYARLARPAPAQHTSTHASTHSMRHGATGASGGSYKAFDHL